MLLKNTLLLVILISSFILPQRGIISGKVTDQSTGDPLVGANIVLKGTMYGNSTDINGFFKIKNLPAGIYSLKASYIGYASVTIKDISLKQNDSLYFDIKLAAEAVDAEEVTIKAERSLIEKNVSTLMSGVISYDQINSISQNDIRYPIDAFNTEEYNLIVENEFLDAYSNPLSTFSIDVDAASYSNARRFLMDGHLPPKDAVRIEEFINYFDYDYALPEGDSPFSVFTELGECPWNKENYLMNIGIKGKELSKEEMKPGNLVFLIDVSGSMEPENKLPLLKRAFAMMVNKLSPEDKISIVVYAGAAGLILPATKGSEKEKIIEAIGKLQSGGSTAGGAGIKLAYKIAEENFIKGGNNRIILATDGDFNVGVSSTSELVRIVEGNRDKGIFLTILGFGMGNYKDGRLEEIADKGNGNYYYIDNILEAKKVLSDEIMSTLFTIAKDVKIQIEFNPAKVKKYRLIGYENRLLKKEDFENDKKDAGELGSGHTVTALYEVIPVSDVSAVRSFDNLKYQESKLKEAALSSDEVMTLNIRYKAPAGDTSELISQPVKEKIVKIDESSNNFQFSAAVAMFAMLLRESQFKGESNYNVVKEMAERSLGEDKYGYRDEFVSLVNRAKRLSEEPE
jgi:Ca-activated chloride channel family protein